MKKYIFIFALLAIVAGSATVAPTQAKAVQEQCTQWTFDSIVMDQFGNAYNRYRRYCPYGAPTIHWTTEYMDVLLPI
jgi:hypothetical protein